MYSCVHLEQARKRSSIFASAHAGVRFCAADRANYLRAVGAHSAKSMYLNRFLSFEYRSIGLCLLRQKMCSGLCGVLISALRLPNACIGASFLRCKNAHQPAHWHKCWVAVVRARNASGYTFAAQCALVNRFSSAVYSTGIDRNRQQQTRRHDWNLVCIVFVLAKIRFRKSRLHWYLIKAIPICVLCV